MGPSQRDWDPRGSIPAVPRYTPHSFPREIPYESEVRGEIHDPTRSHTPVPPDWDSSDLRTSIHAVSPNPPFSHAPIPSPRPRPLPPCATDSGRRARSSFFHLSSLSKPFPSCTATRSRVHPLSALTANNGLCPRPTSTPKGLAGRPGGGGGRNRAPIYIR